MNLKKNTLRLLEFRFGIVCFSGGSPDRTNGLSLLSHHDGDDGEWLAMIEHGVPTLETSRTTYASRFSEYDKHDLAEGVFGGALAIYDERGLMSCQPSHNKTNSFSNGHQLFVANPRDALLAVIR